jgi:hypothetical protein
MQNYSSINLIRKKSLGVFFFCYKGNLVILIYLKKNTRCQLNKFCFKNNLVILCALKI